MNVKIAIPFEDGAILPHFGKATKFKIYTVENDVVASSEVCDTDGVGHEDVALWLVVRGVNAVICSNIGPGALGALAAAGVDALAGVQGDADEAIEQLLAGTLEAVSTATCGGHGGGCGGHCGGHCGHGGCCH